MTCGMQLLVMCLQNLRLADTIKPWDLQVLYQVCVRPVEPEPFFGVSRYNIRRKIKHWMENQHLVLWHGSCGKLTYLLTHSMVQSPSWEANWFAASQEIPHISRNPKVHYCTHKHLPTISILGQPNQVHIPTSHLLEIHPNIIHPSTPRSSQWSPSLRFPHQDPIHPPLLTHTRHMPSPVLVVHRLENGSLAQTWLQDPIIVL